MPAASHVGAHTAQSVDSKFHLNLFGVTPRHQTAVVEKRAGNPVAL
jgi:hypothetical protein